MMTIFNSTQVSVFLACLLTGYSALKIQFLESEPLPTSIEAPSSALDQEQRRRNSASLASTKIQTVPAEQPSLVNDRNVYLTRESGMPSLQPMSFHLVSHMTTGDSFPRMMSAVLTIIIVAGLISILLWFLPEEEEGSKPIDTAPLAMYKASPDSHIAYVSKVPSRETWQAADVDLRETLPIATPIASEKRLPIPTLLDASPPKSREELEFVVEGSDGTWAEAYRESFDKRREALELLFRCGIIPVHEFTRSRVSPEHISECVWIATNMLNKKRLEEWVESWAEATQVFEESVTQFFSARTEELESQTKRSTQDLADDFDISLLRAARMGDYDDPYVTRPTPQLNETTKDDSVFNARDSRGRNLLIMRCREIMSSTRRDESDELAPAASVSPPTSTELFIPRDVQDDQIFQPNVVQQMSSVSSHSFRSSLPLTIPETEPEDSPLVARQTSNLLSTIPSQSSLLADPSVRHSSPTASLEQHASNLLSPNPSQSSLRADPSGRQVSPTASLEALKLRVQEAPVAELYGPSGDKGEGFVSVPVETLRLKVQEAPVSELYGPSGDKGEGFSSVPSSPVATSDIISRRLVSSGDLGKGFASAPASMLEALGNRSQGSSAADPFTYEDPAPAVKR